MTCCNIIKMCKILILQAILSLFFNILRSVIQIFNEERVKATQSLDQQALFLENEFSRLLMTV